MSRIGKLPVLIPDGVEVNIASNNISVKGSKGELNYSFSELMNVKSEEGKITVSPKNETREARSLYGLTRTMINNIIKGVSEGFEKRLSIHGVGYNAKVEGKNMTLNLGFSHPVNLEVPEGVEARVEKNIVVIAGANKEKVGQFAADIRSLKKPEPYKGKGIKYIDERIIRKAGKTAK